MNSSWTCITDFTVTESWTVKLVMHGAIDQKWAIAAELETCCVCVRELIFHLYFAKPLC